MLDGLSLDQITMLEQSMRVWNEARVRVYVVCLSIALRRLSSSSASSPKYNLKSVNMLDGLSLDQITMLEQSMRVWNEARVRVYVVCLSIALRRLSSSSASSPKYNLKSVNMLDGLSLDQITMLEQSMRVWNEARQTRDFSGVTTQHCTWVLLECMFTLIEQSRAREGHLKPTNGDEWWLMLESEFFPIAWNRMINRMYHNIDSPASLQLPLPIDVKLAPGIVLDQYEFVGQVLGECASMICGADLHSDYPTRLDEPDYLERIYALNKDKGYPPPSPVSADNLFTRPYPSPCPSASVRPYPPAPDSIRSPPSPQPEFVRKGFAKLAISSEPNSDVEYEGAEGS